MTENFPDGAEKPVGETGPADAAPQSSSPSSPDSPSPESAASQVGWSQRGSAQLEPRPEPQPGSPPEESPVPERQYPAYPPLEQQQTGPGSGPTSAVQVPQGRWPSSGGFPQQPGPQQQPGHQQQAGYQQQPGFGGGYGPPTGPVTAAYGIGGLGPEQPRPKRPTGLVIGVALLALVLGGAAGGLGGYLVSSNNKAEVVSSLDQSVPASQRTTAPAGSVQAVANKVLPQVVTIAAEFEDQGQLNGDTGSGIIISSDGDILTNNHVIAEAADGGRIQVIFANGRTVAATVVGRDPTTDIAVIRAQNVTGLPVAKLGRSSTLSVGQDVVAIGAPFELAGTVTSGIISSLHRPTEAGDGSRSQTTVLDAIQTDAAINPGNSGGPLVDMRGNVIGINSAIYSPNTGGVGQQAQGGNVGIGFAIPIDQARRIATEIITTGKAVQTVLGVRVGDDNSSQNGGQNILPDGALISAVTPGGPADKAGLKAGAVVVKANGRAVNSSDGLVAAVHAAAPGDKMTLTLSDGSTVTATLAGQPVNPN